MVFQKPEKQEKKYRRKKKVKNSLPGKQHTGNACPVGFYGFSEEDLRRILFFFAIDINYLTEEIRRMDKKIREIEKINKKEGTELKTLEKMDKKRDKVCDYGKEMMKKKKKPKGK